MRFFTAFCLVFALFSSKSRAQVPTEGFNHVALSVKNLETSRKFYADVFGFEPIAVPFGFGEIRAWFRVADGQELHLLADRKELVTNMDKDASHFSFSIRSADAVEAILKEKGLAYHRQKRRDGAFQIYISDPDGYVIELNEPKK